MRRLLNRIQFDVGGELGQLDIKVIDGLEYDIILGIDFCLLFDVDTCLGRGLWRARDGDWRTFASNADCVMVYMRVRQLSCSNAYRARAS